MEADAYVEDPSVHTQFQQLNIGFELASDATFLWPTLTNRATVLALVHRAADELFCVPRSVCDSLWDPADQAAASRFGLCLIDHACIDRATALGGAIRCFDASGLRNLR